MTSGWGKRTLRWPRQPRRLICRLETRGRFALISVTPEAYSTADLSGLVSLTACRRKLLWLVVVARSELDVLGAEGGDPPRDPVRDVIAPFLFALTLQSANADIVLEAC